MKLKSKILLVAGLTVFSITLVCNLIVVFFLWNISMEDAKKKSMQDAYSTFMEIDYMLSVISAEHNNDVIMRYIFKELSDDYVICCRNLGSYSDTEDVEFIYNNTVLEVSDLYEAEYSYEYNFDNAISSNGINTAKLKYGNKIYFIHRTVYEVGYDVYKIVDVTYVKDRLKFICIVLSVLTVAITFLSQLVISGILNKVFMPLCVLNENAKNIAMGEYRQRIKVSGNDEISELSDNFNKMAEAVEQRTTSLEEAEHKKTLLIGGLTHELKTPITAITGYSKTLLTTKLSEEDKEIALSYIYNEGCRLERLSKKMMNLVLLGEETSLDLKHVRASELFSKVSAACSQILAEKEIELVTNFGDEQFFVDEDLMEEVLVNLIDNAVKASGLKSKIILSANKNEISVCDFGIGIPKEEQDRILEPFYMVDKSRSKKNGGVGLGLSITAMILDKHKCKLSIESEEGNGTVMILQFV